jgi:hypothetical protein
VISPSQAVIEGLERLSSVHLSWGCPPSDDDIRLLLDHGVDGDAMTQPYPIGAANVHFDGNTFDIDPRGQRALTFRAEDRGEVIDLIAWSPISGELASWRGIAFCLGDLDQIFNPATYFMGGVLRLHRSPLEWLRANRDGILIVQPQLAYACLRNACRLSFSYAQQAERWLEPPKPSVELLVEVHGSAAA